MKVQFNFNKSAVIPYRFRNNEIEILLITSIKKKKWVIPKGFIAFNLSPFESAKKEAIEEAGILGSNETIELGSFKKTKASGIFGTLVYSMEVTEVMDDYPEKDLRTRKWFNLDEAIDVISIPEIKGMLKTLPQKII